ncbi:MAG: RNA polymerase sigma factor, partial [Desulfomonilaceae bacterium]
HRFMMVSSIKTWLYTIALNAMRDHLRKSKAILVPDMLDQLGDPAESADESLDRARNLERIRKAMETLPEKQRLTVQLRIYEEMDYKEIAKVLGGPGTSRKLSAEEEFKKALERATSRKRKDT